MVAAGPFRRSWSPGEVPWVLEQKAFIFSLLLLLENEDSKFSLTSDTTAGFTAATAAASRRGAWQRPVIHRRPLPGEDAAGMAALGPSSPPAPSPGQAREFSGAQKGSLW